MAGARRTAVLVVHGMGEQHPMETLRGFVEAAWVRDKRVHGRDGRVWYKPDHVSRSYELKRITTASGHGGRCDFFEFYWAHLMTGNRASSVIRWLVRLLVRWPWTVPLRLAPHWLFGLAALSAVAFGAFYLAVWAAAETCAVPEGWSACRRADELHAWLEGQQGRIGALTGAGVLLLAVLRYLMPGIVSPIIGDAARYFTPRPDNIGARQSIRAAGVALLDELHRSGEFDRIVVAGHSLGAAVAYDILTHAFAQIPSDALVAAHRSREAKNALEALEAEAARLAAAASRNPGRARSSYREAQRSYAGALRDAGIRWLVTDFVTMGSPLSKADVLVARNRRELDRRIAQRELPTCPPEPDQEGSAAFSYPRRHSGGGEAVRIPHHAAPFAPTVWTNIYFTNPLIIGGDLVGGKTAPRLGRAIADVRVRSRPALFRHLHYWRRPLLTRRPAPWLEALRAALDLRRDAEAAAWGEERLATPIRAERLNRRESAVAGHAPSGREGPDSGP